MASSAMSHKQEIHIKDLPTTSVILYPARAQVTRDLKNIDVQPGHNEIEIYGLTPTADEHSINFNGTGTGSVTDMTVELVPNKDSFEAAFPVDSELESEESEADDVDDEDENSAIAMMEEELKMLSRQNQEASEFKASAQTRLGTLDGYFRSTTPKHTKWSLIEEAMSVYKEERAKAHADEREATYKISDLQKTIEEKQKELRKTKQRIAAEKKKNHKQKTEEKEKKNRQWIQRSEKDRRAREEAAKYWPRKVYKITLHLDISTDTPGSSRRSSISSATFGKGSASIQSDHNEQLSPNSLSLSMTYVTFQASWTPCYDISFDTPTKSGNITFRAELRNKTSETWSDTNISLSTSQASFHGLGDAVPRMQSWRVGLGKGSQDSAMYSKQESTKSNPFDHFGYCGPREGQFGRDQLFGVDHMKKPSQIPPFGTPTLLPGGGSSLFANPPTVPEKGFPLPHSTANGAGFGAPSNVNASFGQQSQPPPPGFGQHHAPSSLFGRPNTQPPATTGGLFGTCRENQSTTTSHTGASLFGAPRENQSTTIPHTGASLFGAVQSRQATATPNPLFGNISTQPTPDTDSESQTWSDTGLTATYDLPTARTLPPSSHPLRTKITSLPFPDLSITRICIPKLRRAAFLRARFTNPSSTLTLLKGTASLTLDGTFLGITTLERVSPGEEITVPLGVDPAVHVSYAEPAVKRGEKGLFNKETTAVYTRSITLRNTKGNAVSLSVLDQIPISEEEKLSVLVVRPAGLAEGGYPVATGLAAKGDKATGSATRAATSVAPKAPTTKEKDPNPKWGEATAKLKAEGKVLWDVKLEAGRACRLDLEWEVRFPVGEGVVVM